LTCSLNCFHWFIRECCLYHRCTVADTATLEVFLLMNCQSLSCLLLLRLSIPRLLRGFRCLLNRLSIHLTTFTFLPHDETFV
jgi:hypothetical protein